jgi:predicted PurR-regulated permease PerM
MISGFVAFMLALFQGSTWMPVGNVFFAILVGIVYSIIGQVESVYFIPRLVGGRVKLHPAVTFVGIIAGALTFGVLGILLAPVIAAHVLSSTSRARRPRTPLKSTAPPRPSSHIGRNCRKIDAII